MKNMVLLLCYARSGGTIFNKVLASIKDNIVLSEVNPLGGGSGIDIDNSCDSIKKQALDWYGISLKSDSFNENVKEIYDISIQKGKNLFIRDWSFVNFSPLKENNFNPPNKFLIINEVKGIEHYKVALVRNAIDVWISRGTPDPDVFFQEYYTYLKQLLKLQPYVIKYENFTINPVIEVKKMLKHVGHSYDIDIDISKSVNYNKVNGDIQKGNDSRGNIMSTIKLLKRKKINESLIDRINNNEDLKKCNKMLGYPSLYQSSQIGLKDRITNKLNRILY